jgi:hypothetical protein
VGRRPMGTQNPSGVVNERYRDFPPTTAAFSRTCASLKSGQYEQL